MRRLTFDQDEFDSPESDQALELVISTPGKHQKDLSSFLHAYRLESATVNTVDVNWPKWRMVADHLRGYGGIEMPHPSKVRAAILLRDEWNDVEVALAFGDVHVWYHWTMSA